MMAKKTIPLCNLTQTSSAQEMVPQTEHPQTGMDGCQARALSTQSLSESLTHLPSLKSRPSPLLRDALVPTPAPVPMLMLVVAQLS